MLFDKTGWFSYAGSDIEAGCADRYNISFDPSGSIGARSGKAHQVIAGGSSVNGPSQGSFGTSISIFKEGFGTSEAKGGEIDGLYIVGRQDTRDGVRADGCGLLIDMAAYDNPGFIGGIEGATSRITKAANSIDYRISYQIGCYDYSSRQGAAYYGKAAIGVVSHGIHLASEQGYFNKWVRYQVGGTHDVYSLSKDGVERLASFNSSASMSRFVDAAGVLHFINHAQNVDLVTLDQSGNLGLYGALDLRPVSSPPPIKQGRIWFNRETGNLMICRDNATWSSL